MNDFTQSGKKCLYADTYKGNLEEYFPLQVFVL